jgi:hypothetical protein
VTTACATLVVAFFSMAGFANSEKGEPLDGKWDTNWGLVKIFQDDIDVDGWWECNCPDGRKAVINAELNDNADGDLVYKNVDGRWKCPGAEDARGRFEVDFRLKLDKPRLVGHFWTKGNRDEQERWVGEKETN